MTVTDKAFTGSIPELYERHLVPLIFEPYARDLAEEVRRLTPGSVLETAAGTGVVTRALAPMLPAATRLVATDLNTAMLDVARTHVPCESPVEWRQADALALPFAGETFDAVICQFGVMFFPHKQQGFREAWRVLRPSGRYLFSVWDESRSDVRRRAKENMAATRNARRPGRGIPLHRACASARMHASSSASWPARSSAILRR